MTPADPPGAPEPSVLDPRTLRFHDPPLEADYQRETMAEIRRQTLLVLPISIVL